MPDRLRAVDRSPPTGAALTIEIKNTKPVELTDLTRSFLSFADEFKRTLETNDPEAAAADVRLYVKEMRTGSIIADVIAISPHLLQGVSYADAVWSFAKHLVDAYEFLSGKSSAEPELDRTSYENLSSFVEPIAKDSGSQVNIGTINGPVYLTLNSTEANAAQNTARRKIEELREPVSRMHEQVVLYWYQARNDPNSAVGDKGIIESIHPRAVKVLCATDAIKSRMVLDDANPFRYAYVVDVIVETVRNKPAAYKVIAVHERIEPDLC
jgi:hypothetical protein